MAVPTWRRSAYASANANAVLVALVFAASLAAASAKEGDGMIHARPPKPSTIPVWTAEDVAGFIEHTEPELGPIVFLDFFAPWCAHCKKLDPVLNQLQALIAIKGKSLPREVLVAKVDATQRDNKALARQYKVDGYPTLMALVDGAPVPYEEMREANAMADWLHRLTEPGVLDVAEGDVDEFLKMGLPTKPNYILVGDVSDDVFDKWHAVMEPILGTHWVGHLAEPSEAFLTKTFHGGKYAKNTPFLAVAVNGKTPGEQQVYTGSLEDTDALAQWMDRMRFSLVTELSMMTYGDVIKSPRTMAVIAGEKKPMEDFVHKAEMELKAYSDRFIFCWADSKKLDGWLEDMFLVAEDVVAYPTVIVYHPANNSYQLDNEWHSRAESDEKSLVDFLEDVLTMKVPVRITKEAPWHAKLSHAVKGNEVLAYGGLLLVNGLIFGGLWLRSKKTATAGQKEEAKKDK